MHILASTVVACVSVLAFTSLDAVPLGIRSAAVGLKICGITAEIKNYKSIIKKKRQEGCSNSVAEKN